MDTSTSKLTDDVGGFDISMDPKQDQEKAPKMCPINVIMMSEPVRPFRISCVLFRFDSVALYSPGPIINYNLARPIPLPQCLHRH